MNEIILTVRATLGAGYQVVFLKRIKLMRREARHDLSDKNVFAGAKLSVSITLASFLSCVCWITSAHSLFLQFLHIGLRSCEYIIHGIEGRFQISLNGRETGLVFFFGVSITDLTLLVSEKIRSRQLSNALVTM